MSQGKQFVVDSLFYIRDDKVYHPYFGLCVSPYCSNMVTLEFAHESGRHMEGYYLVKIMDDGLSLYRDISTGDSAVSLSGGIDISIDRQRLKVIGIDLLE